MRDILPFWGLQLISGAEDCTNGAGPSGSRPLPRSDATSAAAALHSRDAPLHSSVALNIGPQFIIT